MVDFWAAWCQPCRRENPNVVALYGKYKDKGFDIVGVSLDRTKEDWVKAIADDQLSWHQVSELKFWQSDIVQKYGVTAIPCTFLLDKEGKIIAKNLRGEELAKKLEELMGK
jgi:thiol-disulfide isomerase/thioredoxin